MSRLTVLLIVIIAAIIGIAYYLTRLALWQSRTERTTEIVNKVYNDVIQDPKDHLINEINKRLPEERLQQT